MQHNIDRSMWGVIVLIIAVVVGVLAKDKIYAAVDGIFNKMDEALDGVSVGEIANGGGGATDEQEGLDIYEKNLNCLIYFHGMKVEQQQQLEDLIAWKI